MPEEGVSAVIMPTKSRLSGPSPSRASSRRIAAKKAPAGLRVSDMPGKHAGQQLTHKWMKNKRNREEPPLGNEREVPCAACVPRGAKSGRFTCHNQANLGKSCWDCALNGHTKKCIPVPADLVADVSSWGAANKQLAIGELGDDAHQEEGRRLVRLLRAGSAASAAPAAAAAARPVAAPVAALLPALPPALVERAVVALEQQTAATEQQAAATEGILALLTMRF